MIHDAEPMTHRITLWLASCSKLVTSVVATQCVERGYLRLDDELASILPGSSSRESLGEMLTVGLLYNQCQKQ